LFLGEKGGTTWRFAEAGKPPKVPVKTPGPEETKENAPNTPLLTKGGFPNHREKKKRKERIIVRAG